MRMLKVSYHEGKSYKIELAERDSGRKLPCSVTPTTMHHKKTGLDYPGLVYMMSKQLGGDIEYAVAADGWRKDGAMLSRKAQTTIAGELREIEGVFEYAVPVLTDQHHDVNCVYMILTSNKDDAFKIHAALALEEQFNSEADSATPQARSETPDPGDTSSGAAPIASVRRLD
jgi:hypothetical protein